MESRRRTEVSVPGRSNGLPRFPRGRVDPYGGRLLPVCCPTQPARTVGTTIRIALPIIPAA
jgi:hypothetical protein